MMAGHSFGEWSALIASGRVRFGSDAEILATDDPAAPDRLFVPFATPTGAPITTSA